MIVRKYDPMKRYDPFDMFERMSDALDFARDVDNWFDFTESMFPDNTWGLFEGDWSPRLDLYENDDAYFVRMDMPGIEQKEIEINILNDVLTAKGRRKAEEDAEGRKAGRKYQREERIFGSFHRTVPLPLPVDASRVEAKLEDGVLSLTLPKREETKPRKISVKVS
jgi:HSP20 family protein